MASSAPAPDPTRLPASTGADEAWKFGESTLAKLNTRTRTISATSRVASTRPLTATSRTPRIAVSAQQTSASTHHLMSRPNQSLNSGDAMAPKPPYDANWKQLYDSSASQAPPTPNGRPMPCEM